MNEFIAPVELEKSYRLLNHGPTVLVSGSHGGVDNVMTAAWSCALDFTPSKVMVVLDKITKTRELIEKSGTFVLQVPTVAQLQLTYDLGRSSLFTEPEKLVKTGVQLFSIEGHDGPFVEGCSAWLSCRLINEPHNQQAHDMFIGEVIGAWADTRVFKNGHWEFESSDPDFRSLHYIAGGNFYAIGESLQVERE